MNPAIVLLTYSIAWRSRVAFILGLGAWRSRVAFILGLVFGVAGITAAFWVPASLHL